MPDYGTVERNTMNVFLMIFIFVELIMAVLFVIGALHEDVLVDFEDRLIETVKYELAQRRARKDRAERRRYEARIEYRPVKPPRHGGASSKDAA